MMHRRTRIRSGVPAAFDRPHSASTFRPWPAVCCIVTALTVLMSPMPAVAEEEVINDQDEEQARTYTTREERREAGVKHKIIDGLTVSALAEVEYLYERSSLIDTASHNRDDELSQTLQLGLDLTPWRWAKGELIYEFENTSGENLKGTLDEAIVAFEARDFELELGKLFLPFGEYFSHFVTGPLLEFGETRGRAAVLSYGPDDRLDISAFLYKGKAKEAESDSGNLDWGFAAEASPFEFVSLGLSYLSDLADSEEEFLSDSNDRYESRVSGLSGYALFGYDQVELTAEFVRALDSFNELDSDRNQPRAWNLELAYYPQDNLEWALRLEGSNEFEDEPRLQGGISVTWRVTRTAFVTLEYLRGAFTRGLAEDSEERELDQVQQIGALVSIEF